jgi:hypothetical protein
MLNGEVMRTQEDEYRASNRQITNLIDPFVALRGHPQQQEFFDCGAQRQLLWNQDQTWAGLPMNEFMEISWHRPDIMRYQDASFLGSDFKDSEIIFPSRSRFESLQETYTGFAASYSQHDRSSQIFVRQEFDFQACEVSPRRAHSNRSRKAAGMGG